MTGGKDTHFPVQKFTSIQYFLWSKLAVELCSKLMSREMISNMKPLIIHVVTDYHVVMIIGHRHIGKEQCKAGKTKMWH